MDITQRIVNSTRGWYPAFVDSVRGQTWLDTVNWLECNCVEQYFIVGGKPCEIRFKSEKDLVLFQLRWQ